MKTVQQQIQEEYYFLDKLGFGAFGSIIQVKGKKDQKIYAIKIQKTSMRKTILVQKQFNILVQLMDSKRFPQVYSLKKNLTNSYMIMEKLSQNLDNIFQASKKNFNIKTIALISYQMFKSLQLLHKSGYIHRDLKPENMMTTLNSHTIKLIDFGLADSLNPKRSSALIGNVRYCSRDGHIGLSSPKDDLQSLIYCIFYLFDGSLPWQDSSADQIQLQISRRIDPKALSVEMTPILNKKHNFLKIFQFPSTSNKLKKLFYEQLQSFAQFILDIQDKQNPDYRIINYKIQRLLGIAGVSKHSCFQWCKPDCNYQVKTEDYWKVLE